MKNIIQIGTACGNDNLKSFLIDKHKDYFVHLIEPNIQWNAQIQENYSFTEYKKIWNFLIGTENTYQDFYFKKSHNDQNQVASISLGHLIAHNVNNEDIVKATLLTVDINTLFNIIGCSNLEYLLIDTEGSDCDIIKTIDFSKCNIKNIIFEILHTEGTHNGYGKNYKETRDFLISNGYQQTEQCALLGNEGWNVCFTKEI